jgi:hypothetical protein
MAALIFLVLNLAASLFKPRWRLEAENAALRQQLIVLQRKVRGRVEFTNSDRLFFIQLYRWFPSILKAITTFRPKTLVRWHRAGFRRYWRWKSRNLGGRPQIAVDLRALIRRMSVENLHWGTPRIHGELLKLGLVRREASEQRGIQEPGRYGQEAAQPTTTMPPKPRILGGPANVEGEYPQEDIDPMTFRSDQASDRHTEMSRARL